MSERTPATMPATRNRSGLDATKQGQMAQLTAMVLIHTLDAKGIVA